MTHWLALFFCVIANVTANVSLKRFVQATDFEPTMQGLIQAVLQPWLWVSLFACGLVLGSYVYAIKVVPLSAAYPIVTSLATIGIALAGAFIFGESLKAAKIMGVLLVVSGVLMIMQG
jgi:multidrug transporter EmrE-like cation transporter